MLTHYIFKKIVDLFQGKKANPMQDQSYSHQYGKFVLFMIVFTAVLITAAVR